jgi:hypothetical protein
MGEVDLEKWRCVEYAFERDMALNLYIAPYSFGLNNNQMTYQEKTDQQRRIKVTLDDLKRISEVKCEVVYRPGN